LWWIQELVRQRKMTRKSRRHIDSCGEMSFSLRQIDRSWKVESCEATIQCGDSQEVGQSQTCSRVEAGVIAIQDNEHLNYRIRPKRRSFRTLVVYLLIGMFSVLLACLIYLFYHPPHVMGDGPLPNEPPEGSWDVTSTTRPI